jgi:DNA-binding SARP family transcriptional activator/WD40 repeat protein
MRCAVLGPLEVRGDDGAVLNVPGAKERQLLAVLASAYPDAVSVDALLESLWDGSPPATGRKSLQAHVVRLRTALEPDRAKGSPGRFVVRRPHGYALAVGREELDATAFIDRVTRGRALLAGGDPVTAHDVLREALDLWRGTPFADWPDSTGLDAERGRLSGIHALALEAWWEAELALGRHAEAVPELERLAVEQPLHEPWWALLALALYRSGRQGDALDALRRARGVLSEQLGVDPGPRLRELEEAVLAQDSWLDGSPPPVPARVETQAIAGCPYKGLARYEMDDAALFHGRDRLVQTLVVSLVDHRLLVVSGSSGAGKSSVVRAGLLPALRSGALPGSQQWRPHVVVPGLLAVDALAGLTPDTAPSEPTILVCDQLEQLWSDETSASERTAFLDSVLALVDEDAVARCVLVVRGDHVGRLAEHTDLAQRMLGALVLVPPLAEGELRQIVTEPARGSGLEVDPDLVEQAVRDVLGRHGALPLLSTALAETWGRRQGGRLTLAGYLASGGVTGAVARSAEATWESLPADVRPLARGILVRLAEQDQQGTLRARQLPAAEVARMGADPAVTTSVVESLVGRRLVSRDSGHLEVAHESLLTAWPRLAAWLEEDAVGRSVRRHLAPAALEWDAQGRRDDELYRGARLQAAAEWASTPGSEPTGLEREFIDAGLVRTDAELRVAQERADAEAAGRRRTRRLAGVLAAALLLALVATGVAVWFQGTASDREHEARAASTVADANRLAALSSSARTLDVSLLLAAAALRTADTPATRDGLLNALLEHRRASGVRQIGREGIEEAALSDNGRTMMATVGGGEPRVLAWRTGSADPPRIIAKWWPESLAVSPDGKTLVAAAALSRTGVFAYTRSGASIRKLPLPKVGGFPRDVAFTPSGELLLCMGQIREGAGPRVVLAEVDLRTGTVHEQAIIARARSRNGFFDAAFSQDGAALVVFRADERLGGTLERERAVRVDVASGAVTRLDLARRDATSQEFFALPDGAAQTWSDGAVTLYDEAGRAVQELTNHRTIVRDLRVLDEGNQAVTVGEGGQVELWDVSPQDGRWTPREPLVGHSVPVVDVEQSADGDTLLTASSDGQLVTWDLTDDAGFGTSYRGLRGRWVSNRIEEVEPGEVVVAPTRTLADRPRGFQNIPGARTLSVAAAFLDPRSGRLLDIVGTGETLPQTFGSSVAVSPDATMVAVTSIKQATILDTRTHRVISRVRIPETYSSDASWLPDGSALILASEAFKGEDWLGGRVYVVDTDDWALQRTLDLGAGGPQVMEWSPDRTVMALGVNGTGSVVLFDDGLDKLRTVDLGEGGDVFDLSFSPDGRYLAAGRTGGQLAVLDTATWEPVSEPASIHGGPIIDVEWLPDSNTVVTSGKEEMVSLYDVERDLVRGRPFPASEKPGDGYTFLLPFPTEEVVVVNEGGPGHVFPLDPARWLAQACTVAGRDLTHAEWARYLPDQPYRPVCDLSTGQHPESSSSSADTFSPR